MRTQLQIALGCVLLACASWASPTGTNPGDLLGKVVQEDGAPVTNATVFIYTAGPKVGSGVLCPSCYPDCGKKASTKDRGNFSITGLDTNLIFRLLVVAPGFESKYAAKTDPLQGPKEIKLKRLTEAKLKAPSRIVGMVMNEDGKPLAGASISPEGVSRGTSTRWGGTDQDVDPLAITDENGRFFLYCTNDVQRVHALAEGRGVAKRWVELTPGRDHIIRMEEGAAVTGKVIGNGAPVKGVLLGLATKERRAGEHIVCDSLATDQDGTFFMPNIPPNREMVLYARMGSIPNDGTIASRGFTTGKTGSRTDLDKLEVRAGYRVAGRVVLSDGKPIPAKTRIFIGREDAWDHAETMLGADGKFDFRGVPAEAVGISVRIPDYKLSKRIPSLDWLNGGMVGVVDKDMDDLIILLEPGKWRFNGEEGEPSSGESQPRDKPLRGAPPEALPK